MSADVYGFTTVEETILHVEWAYGPWNMQLELGSGTPLDVVRLREAIRAACRHHPVTRMRAVVGRRLHGRYRWERLDLPARVPLEVVDCRDDAHAEEHREEFYSRRISLAEPPPFLALLLRMPDGRDVFALSVSHVAMDGVGMVRMAQSITRAYRDEPDPEDGVDPAVARDLDRWLCCGSRLPARLARTATAGLGLLRDATLGPSRLAPQGADPRQPYRYGSVGRSLSAEQAASLRADRAPGSLNDVLLAALHLAFVAWNAEHGSETGQVTTMMPLNLRPPTWAGEVATPLVGFAQVTTTAAAHVDRAATIAAIAEQTSRIKQDRGALMRSLRLGLRPLPLALRRQVPTALALTGHRLVPSTVLSNLGRVAEPPTFDADGTPPDLARFGVPVQMPLGVSIGALTFGDTLHLTLRHSRAQFDRAAAEEFLDLLVEQLLGW